MLKFIIVCLVSLNVFAKSEASRKVDFLFVIDNSGTMQTSQQNLAYQMEDFIKNLKLKNLDFRIAVTTTDAYRGNFSSQSSFSQIMNRFRRGPIVGLGSQYDYSPDSGFHFVDNQTPNLAQILMTNVLQGASGSGDERAFASFKNVLSYSGNTEFRPGQAKLSIIIISDEDDFSTDIVNYVAGDYYEETDSDPLVLQANSDPRSLFYLYADPRLVPISYYKLFLDGYAGAGRYSVHNISILDTDCKVLLNASMPSRRIGRRYMELSALTGGTSASICGDFSTALYKIIQ